MDYDKIIEQLISEFELDSKIGRKKAYQKCIEYADLNLDDTSDYNPFVTRASEMLGQEKIHRDIARRTVEESGDEKLHLTYSKETGPVLTGNASGLSYLSRVIKNLSEAKINSEHSHFYYGEPPLYGNSYPLIVYLEDDDWFVKHAQDDKKEGRNGTTKYKCRDIDVDKIVAFLVCGRVPPDFMMTQNKIYKVSSCEKYKDQDVWVKEIRGATDRVFTFKFRRDDDEIEEIALDLDDKTVLFFTKDDLTQLV